MVVRAGFCSCPLDKFVMAVTPGLPHLHAINILHLDYFLSQRQLVPRHCASARLQIFCNRDSLPVSNQLCTVTLVILNKICTRNAKTRAIPSPPERLTSFSRAGLHPMTFSAGWRISQGLRRDNFLAKVPGLCPDAASVTCPPCKLAPRCPDISCRNFTLGPLYCRAVR
jgi:hypothetical protein